MRTDDCRSVDSMGPFDGDLGDLRRLAAEARVFQVPSWRPREMNGGKWMDMVG